MIVRSSGGGLAAVGWRGVRRSPVIVGHGRRVMALAGLGDVAPGAPISTPGGACTPTSCAGPYSDARNNYLVQFQMASAQPANQPGYISELATGRPLMSNGDFRALFGWPFGQCAYWDAVCFSCMQQAAAAADAMWTSTRGVWPVGTRVDWQCDKSQAPAPMGGPAQAATPAGSYIPAAALVGGQVVFSGGNPLQGSTVPVAGQVATPPAPAASPAAPAVASPTAPPASGPASQSNAPGAAVVGGGAAQSNAAGSSVAVPASVADVMSSAKSFLSGSYFSGIPNWALAGGAAAAVLLFMRGGKR